MEPHRLLASRAKEKNCFRTLCLVKDSWTPKNGERIYADYEVMLTVDPRKTHSLSPFIVRPSKSERQGQEDTLERAKGGGR